MCVLRTVWNNHEGSIGRLCTYIDGDIPPSCRRPRPGMVDETEGETARAMEELSPSYRCCTRWRGAGAMFAWVCELFVGGRVLL